MGYVHYVALTTSIVSSIPSPDIFLILDIAPFFSNLISWGCFLFLWDNQSWCQEVSRQEREATEGAVCVWLTNSSAFHCVYNISGSAAQILFLIWSASCHPCKSAALDNRLVQPQHMDVHIISSTMQISSIGLNDWGSVSCVQNWNAPPSTEGNEPQWMLWPTSVRNDYLANISSFASNVQLTNNFVINVKNNHF